MSETGHLIAIIGVAAGCTAFLRAAPFLVFGGKRKVPEWIRYLGKFLPAAVMAVLVAYCLQGIDLWRGNHGLPELLATGLVILLHGWKKNILLTVLLGTVCYMLMVQVIFT